MKVSLSGRLSPLVPIVAAIACMALAATPVRCDQQGAQKPAIAMPLLQLPAGMDYRIQLGDQLDYFVIGHDDLRATVTVLPDGLCAFPWAGTVHAAGMTELELTTLLEKKLSGMINSPAVTIIVHPSATNAPLGAVSILGAVKTPGQYPIMAGARLFDLIAVAGGLAQNPSDTDILVLRSGAAAPIHISGSALFAMTDISQNVPIVPGDSIVAQAPEKIVLPEIQIAGEVARAGGFDVPKEGVTLTAAMAMAGGALPGAALTRAQISHGDQVRVVDITQVSEDMTDSASKQRLMPGDVMLVPTNFNRYSIVGEVKVAGSLPISENSQLTVTQAVLNAGGTTSNADLMKSHLVRRDSSGKVIVIPFDLGQVELGKGTDFLVDRGDIIYIPTRRQPNTNLTTWLSVLTSALSIWSIAKK